MRLSELNDLLLSPAESLNVELKTWMDLSQTENQAKVAKELLALRNANGGVLVFGFDDKTLEPVALGRPEDIKTEFHSDVIQRLVKEFSLPSFEVKVLFGERGGLQFPAIVVGPGVQSPVITRRSCNASEKLIIRQNVPYVRSIFQGVVESTEPRSREDWDQLLRICFDNREADIARFFRRHLGPISEELLSISGSQQKIPTAISLDFLEQGDERYKSAMAIERKNGRPPSPTDPKGWREVAVAVSGPIKEVSATHLLEELFSRHPRFTGWPAWIDSRGHSKSHNHPYVLDQGWQALVLRGGGVEPAIDFWRVESNGRFYLRQTLEDDREEKLGDQRGKVLDFVLVVLRATEALATAHEFARALSKAPEENSIEATFRWRGLDDRELVSWVDLHYDFWTATKSRQSDVVTKVTVPLETPQGALSAYVTQAVKPVFEIFGYAAPNQLIEEVADKLLRRSL